MDSRARAEGIHVRLAGGLGNQLFQIATALVLGEKSTDKCTWTDATARYGVARSASAISELIPALAIDRPAPNIVRALHRLRFGRWSTPWSVNDRSIRAFLGTDSSYRRPLLLDGYFQDCWDSATVHRAIAAIATLITPVQSTDRVVVHVRGGDFLQLPAFQVAGDDYYARAFRQALRAWPACASACWEVHTDDTEHAYVVMRRCAEPLGLNWRLAETGSLVSDFQALRAARFRIVGNSSFAWWAAALSSNGSQTLSPAHWTVERRKMYRLHGETVLD